MQATVKNIRSFLDEKFIKESPVSHIITTAGGFEMSEITSTDIFDSYTRMFAKNSASALMAAHLAAAVLESKGTLVMTGALTPYKQPTPNMLTYALSKNFVHTLNINLAKDPNFVKRQLNVYTMLPSMIDTEANRQAMPDADRSTWLDPAKMSEYLYMLCTSINRPQSGSFIELTAEKGSVNAKIH
jgi:short-subunit dehydrogenase